jgi:hypothetical protein
MRKRHVKKFVKRFPCLDYVEYYGIRCCGWYVQRRYKKPTLKQFKRALAVVYCTRHRYLYEELVNNDK